MKTDTLLQMRVNVRQIGCSEWVHEVLAHIGRRENKWEPNFTSRISRCESWASLDWAGSGTLIRRGEACFTQNPEPRTVTLRSPCDIAFETKIIWNMSESDHFAFEIQFAHVAVCVQLLCFAFFSWHSFSCCSVWKRHFLRFIFIGRNHPSTAQNQTDIYPSNKKNNKPAQKSNRTHTHYSGMQRILGNPRNPRKYRLGNPY